MNYPASHLTPFLPALPAKAPFASGHRSLVPHTAKLLNTHSSIACTLLNSLASLFAHAFLCFQSFADSFCKTPGVGVSRRQSRCTWSRSQDWLAELHNFAAPITTFRINTYISVASKQLYLPLESTLVKKGGEGGPLQGSRSQTPTFSAGPFGFAPSTADPTTPLGVSSACPDPAGVGKSSSFQPQLSMFSHSPLATRHFQPSTVNFFTLAADANVTACSHLGDTTPPQCGHSMSEPSVTLNKRTAIYKGDFHEFRSENFAAPRRPSVVAPQLASSRPGPLFDRSTIRIRVRAIWTRRHAGHRHSRHARLCCAQERLRFGKGHRHRSGRGRRSRRRP